jgi:hypothetical protein
VYYYIYEGFVSPSREISSFMGPFMPGTLKCGSNARFGFRVVLLMSKIISLDFVGGGKLSVRQIDTDLIAVTGTGLSFFAGGTELAQAIGESFNTTCQAQRSPGDGFAWDYDFVYQLGPGISFNNPQAFLEWVEARLRLTISCMDELEKAS